MRKVKIFKKVDMKKLFRFLYLAVPYVLLTPRASFGAIDFSDQVRGMGKKIYGTENPADIKDTIANLIRIVLGFVGIIFLLLIIWGGLQWMLSGGNEQKIEDAKKRIVHATIGLTVIVMAYAIASFVVSSLGQATSD